MCILIDYFMNYFKNKRIQELQIALQTAHIKYIHYNGLCEAYRDMSYKAQFKEWDIQSCQNSINVFEDLLQKAECTYDIDKWTNKLQILRDKKTFLEAELKILYQRIQAGKVQHNKNFEMFCECGREQRELIEKLQILQ